MSELFVLNYQYLKLKGLVSENCDHVYFPSIDNLGTLICKANQATLRDEL